MTQQFSTLAISASVPLLLVLLLGCISGPGVAGFRIWEQQDQAYERQHPKLIIEDFEGAKTDAAVFDGPLSTDSDNDVFPPDAIHPFISFSTRTKDPFKQFEWSDKVCFPSSFLFFFFSVLSYLFI